MKLTIRIFTLVLTCMMLLTSCTTETTKPTSTTNPTGNLTKNPTETAKPTTDSSKKPTKEPSQEPSVETSKPTADVSEKPTIDPTKDYSEWGYYGFENLLPAPLPFSDETKWLSMTKNNFLYEITNDTRINSVSQTELAAKILEYVKSLEKFGFTIVSQSEYRFMAMNLEKQSSIEISIPIEYGYFIVSIT